MANEIKKIKVGTTDYDIVPDKVKIDTGTDSLVTVGGNYDHDTNKLVTVSDASSIVASVIESKTGTITPNVSPHGTAEATKINAGAQIKIGKGYYSSDKYYEAEAQTTLSGNATEAQVLSGKTFYSNSYTKKTGTMTNRGAVSATITSQNGTYTIPAGYHNGSGTVTADLPNATFEVDGPDVNSVTGGYVPANTGVGTVATATRANTTLTATADTTNAKLTLNAANNQATGYVEGANKTASKTVTLSVSGATVTASTNDSTPVTVSKSVASGTAGTPSATKGIASSYSLDVTPSVTNTTGYITGGTKTGTAVTVSPSDLGLTQKTALSVSGRTVSLAAGSYNTIDLSASVSSMTLPTSASTSASGTSKATVTPSTSQEYYINIPTGYNSTASYYKINKAPAANLENKNMTGSPQTLSLGQIIRPSSGYAGMSMVTLPNEVSTLSINKGDDSNIFVDNLRISGNGAVNTVVANMYNYSGKITTFYNGDPEEAMNGNIGTIYNQCASQINHFYNVASTINNIYNTGNEDGPATIGYIYNNEGFSFDPSQCIINHIENCGTIRNLYNASDSTIENLRLDGGTVNINQNGGTLNIQKEDGIVTAQNLTASNIKSGVEILGVTGTYTGSSPFTTLVSKTLRNVTPANYPYVNIKPSGLSHGRAALSNSSSSSYDGSVTLTNGSTTNCGRIAGITSSSQKAILTITGYWNSSGTQYVYYGSTATGTTYNVNFTASAGEHTYIIVFEGSSASSFYNTVYSM